MIPKAAIGLVELEIRTKILRNLSEKLGENFHLLPWLLHGKDFPPR